MIENTKARKHDMKTTRIRGSETEMKYEIVNMVLLECMFAF